MDGFNEIRCRQVVGRVYWERGGDCWLIDDAEDAKAAIARSQPGTGRATRRATQQRAVEWESALSWPPCLLAASGSGSPHTLSVEGRLAGWLSPGRSAASRRQKVPVMMIGEDGQEAAHHPKQGTQAVTLHVTLPTPDPFTLSMKSCTNNL